MVTIGKKDLAASIGPGCHCACDWDLQFNAFFQAQIQGNACGCACQAMLLETVFLSAYWEPGP